MLHAAKCSLVKRLIAVVLLGMTQHVMADDPVGMVVAVRGEVLAGQRVLQQGDMIHQDDEILTSDRSFAVLQFHDGARVTVRPDSTLIIEQYTTDAAELNLLAGGLRIVTGSMAKTNPENYKLRTPVALMGVRGTEFSVQLCEENCSANSGG